MELFGDAWNDIVDVFPLKMTELLFLGTFIKYIHCVEHPHISFQLCQL